MAYSFSHPKLNMIVYFFFFPHLKQTYQLSSSLSNFLMFLCMYTQFVFNSTQPYSQIIDLSTLMLPLIMHFCMMLFKLDFIRNWVKFWRYHPVLVQANYLFVSTDCATMANSQVLFKCMHCSVRCSSGLMVEYTN